MKSKTMSSILKSGIAAFFAALVGVVMLFLIWLFLYWCYHVSVVQGDEVKKGWDRSWGPVVNQDGVAWVSARSQTTYFWEQTLFTFSLVLVGIGLCFIPFGRLFRNMIDNESPFIVFWNENLPHWFAGPVMIVWAVLVLLGSLAIKENNRNELRLTKVGITSDTDIPYREIAKIEIYFQEGGNVTNKGRIWGGKSGQLNIRKNDGTLVEVGAPLSLVGFSSKEETDYAAQTRKSIAVFLDTIRKNAPHICVTRRHEFDFGVIGGRRNKGEEVRVLYEFETETDPFVDVTISLADNPSLIIKNGHTSIFNIQYDKLDAALQKATLVCELLGTLSDTNEEVFEWSFHSVELPAETGSITAAFTSNNAQAIPLSDVVERAHGRAFESDSEKSEMVGAMKICLVKEILPDPKPRRVFVFSVGGSVYTGRGSFLGAEFQGRKVEVISNVLEVPATTEF